MKERGHLQRAEIAARAAFLLAEEHIETFALAKRKAARQLGYPENGGLPSNEEVEAALVEHRAIYAPEHEDLLRELRQKAVYLLRFFAGFRPYLAGSVLSGVAGPHSDINLILFEDDPKAVELFLLNEQIDFKHKEPPPHHRHDDYPTLAFWFAETPVRLHIRPLSAERNATRRDERERATLAELEQLLAQ
jgi:hypothetical protein